MRAVSIFFCLMFWAAGALAAEPVSLGVLYNISGPMSALDEPGLAGMRLALDEINARGGVLGQPLKLEVRDCASDVEKCRQAAKELVQLKVSAVLGLNDSDFAQAAAEETSRASIPFVTAGATLPDLPGRFAGNFFMICFGDDAQAKAVAKFALRGQGLKRMLLLTDQDTAFTRALSGYFAKSYAKRGGTVVENISFSTASPELFAALPACLADASCQGVYVAGVPEDLLPSLGALYKAGYSGPVYSGDGFDSPLLARLPKEAKFALYFSTHVSYTNPRLEVAAFVRLWKAAYASEPQSGFAALGYDCLGLTANALVRAGSADPVKLGQALGATRKYPGATGEISFPEPGKPPLKPVVIERYAAGERGFMAEVTP